MSASGVLLGHCASLTIVGSSVAGHLIGDLQMGVTVFFVISVFLLYRPFVAADMAGRSPAPTSVFYRRRLLRIIPAYWFALTVVALLPGVISVFTSDQWWRYYLLIQNYSGINFVFARGIGPAWSLSVEMAFYLTLPLFAWAMRRTRGSDPDWRLSGDLIVLGAVAGSQRWSARTSLGDQRQSWPGERVEVDADAQPAAVPDLVRGRHGVRLDQLMERPDRQDSAGAAAAASHPGLVWLFALSCYGLMAAVSPALPSAENAVHHTMTGLIAAAIVFPAAFPNPEGKGVPGWFLALPAVAWVGLISYGLYLWGSPLTLYLAHEGIFSRGAPSCRWRPIRAAALVAAAFSYYVVERPFLRLKYARRGRRWFRRSDPELRRAA